MHYTIYKTTCLKNSKFYIGKHQTKNLDDGYLGSGKLLGRAIKKYGRENFKKEILETFSTEAEMNAAEKRLVILGPQSYNLCEGGNGGFGYINSSEEILKKRDTKENKRKGYLAALSAMTDPEKNKRAQAAGLKKMNDPLRIRDHWIGRKHSEETKAKMSASHNPKSHPKGPRGPYKKKVNRQ